MCVISFCKRSNIEYDLQWSVLCMAQFSIVLKCLKHVSNVKFYYVSAIFYFVIKYLECCVKYFMCKDLYISWDCSISITYYACYVCPFSSWLNINLYMVTIGLMVICTLHTYYLFKLTSWYHVHNYVKYGLCCVFPKGYVCMDFNRMWL